MNAPVPFALPQVIHPRDLTAHVPAVDRLLLALDFDGTLAPIVPHPADAMPLPRALDALTALTACTTVVVISGRPLDELTARFGDVAGLSFIGEHGRVWQDRHGKIHDLYDTGAHQALRDAAFTAVSTVLDGSAGWMVEQKAAGLAVHHRNVAIAEVDRVRPKVLAALEPFLTDGLFRLLHGHAVDELAPAGMSKGTALAHLCAAEPSRVPIAVGDDVTDEDAFVTAHKHGGIGILVASVPRPSGATYCLADPVDVATFLSYLATRSS